MKQACRVAVLEDNAALREEVAFLLQEEGYCVTEFRTAGSFFQSHCETSFDLLLLDLGLPDRDGTEVAQTLTRSGDDIGIIMLTARDSLRDRVDGLMHGADAYLSKPFELAELLAHINALVRRKNYYTVDTHWRVEPASRVLLAPHDISALELTANEVCIMKLLAHYHPEHVSRAELVSGLGEDYRIYDERRLEQIMSRLRKKIREHCQASPIKAVRGRGYVFSEPVELGG